MENRYDNNIREANQMILDLTPGNIVLRLMLAFVLRDRLVSSSAKILELGAGEGDLTKVIFKIIPDIKIDVLDISKEMLQQAEISLVDYKDRANFIEGDAMQYLQGHDGSYNFIISAWTIHNFPWVDKNKLFELMYEKLENGGTMLIMDKIYVDDPKLAEESYNDQIARYKRLPDIVRDDMLRHEVQDFSHDYKMQEAATFEALERVGFKNIKIIDRVGRDVVLIGNKI